MRKPISRTPISVVHSARRSKQFLFSIRRMREPHAAGHGTAIVLNVGVSSAGIMAPATRRLGTPGCGHGGSKIPKRRKLTTEGADLRLLTGFRRMTLSACVLCRTGVARFVAGTRPGFLLIIVTPKGTFGRCCARPAILSLAGMSGRPIPSSSSRVTWPLTRNSAHADVLLELANASTADGEVL